MQKGAATSLVQCILALTFFSFKLVEAHCYSRCRGFTSLIISITNRADFFKKNDNAVALSLMYPLSINERKILHEGEIVKTPLLNLSRSFTYPRSHRIFSECEGLVELIFTVREGREKIEKENERGVLPRTRGYV